MSTTEQLKIAPVPASIDNPGDWEVLAKQITVGTGMPTVVTLEMIVGMIRSAVPLLFAADATRNPNLLRGTFSDSVVAQCLRNSGELTDLQPVTVVVHLVGSRVVDGHPSVRAHLSIQAQSPNGNPSANNQFWDLQIGGQVTVSQPNCPNCGAPIGKGELICGHCHTDVRSVVDVPIVVSRLDLY
jgi:ribosomal protein S27AE